MTLGYTKKITCCKNSARVMGNIIHRSLGLKISFIIENGLSNSTKGSYSMSNFELEYVIEWVS